MIDASPLPRLSRHWVHVKAEWAASSALHRALLVLYYGVSVFLLACLAAGAVVDSTGLAAHLIIFAGILVAFSYLHGTLEQLLTARLFSRHTSIEEGAGQSTTKGLRETWKGHAALFIIYLAASYIPITGIPKGLISVLVLCAVFRLGTLLCGDIYQAAYLGLASAGFTVFMFLDLLHWLPCLPILMGLLLWTWRAIDQQKPSSTQRSVRIASTAASMTVLGISLAFCIPWVFLSTNASWVFDHDYSKYQVLHHFPPETSLNVHLVRGLADLSAYKSLRKPVVIKPNVCTYASRGVQVCHDYDCLRTYLLAGLAAKPPGFSWIIQDYCNYPEAVIFYYRYPYKAGGFIKHIGMRDKARAEAGGTLVAVFRPTHFYEPTEAITKFFDGLADRVPGFSGGRYDVILEAGIDAALQSGTGIRVLEAETFFVDSMEESRRGTEATLESAVKSVKWCRTMALEYWAGVANILVGNQANVFKLSTRLPFIYRSAMLCKQCK